MSSPPAASWAAACAGFHNAYLVPFGDRLSEQLPFGDLALTSDTVAAFRRQAEGAGLRITTMLSPISSTRTVARCKLLVDQAEQLGVKYIIDFGIHGGESVDEYVALMRHVAEHAGGKGMHISMKLHDVVSDATAPVLGPLAAIHDAVGHPAFGLCMDPGNVIYFTAEASMAGGGAQVGTFQLPTDGLAAEAHRFNTFIISDAIVAEDGSPDVMVQPGEGLVDHAAWRLQRPDLLGECSGGN